MPSFVLPLTGILMTGAFIAWPISAAGEDDIRISSRIECKAWTEARASGNAVNYEHYMQGFLDGLSLGAKLDFWGASDKNRLVPSNAFYRLDDYCKSNPSANTFEGAVRIFEARRKELSPAPKIEEKKKR